MPHLQHPAHVSFLARAARMAQDEREALLQGCTLLQGCRMPVRRKTRRREENPWRSKYRKPGSERR
jgi:hypothetical protein